MLSVSGLHLFLCFDRSANVEHHLSSISGRMEPDARAAAVTKAFECAKDMLKWRAFDCGICQFGITPKKGFSIKTTHFGPGMAHPSNEMPYCYQLAHTVASRKSSYQGNVRRAQNQQDDDESDAAFLAELRAAGCNVDVLPLAETWRLPEPLTAGVVHRFTANVLDYFNRDEPTKTAKVQLSHIPGARGGMVTLGELCRGATRVLEVVASDSDLRDELSFSDICDCMADCSKVGANTMRAKDKEIAVSSRSCQSHYLAIAYVW